MYIYTYKHMCIYEGAYLRIKLARLSDIDIGTDVGDDRQETV